MLLFTPCDLFNNFIFPRILQLLQLYCGHANNKLNNDLSLRICTVTFKEGLGEE
jgi:hypothetical protein